MTERRKARRVWRPDWARVRQGIAIQLSLTVLLIALGVAAAALAYGIGR